VSGEYAAQGCDKYEEDQRRPATETKGIKNKVPGYPLIKGNNAVI
jgi:hypothetical protein